MTGEESEHQVKMRADRFEVRSASCYVLAETTWAAFPAAKSLCRM